MTKNISIVTIEHKRVKVSVKIDYDNMEVSLVEKVENSNYKAKQFLFAKRGLGLLVKIKADANRLTEKTKI